MVFVQENYSKTRLVLQKLALKSHDKLETGDLIGLLILQTCSLITTKKSTRPYETFFQVGALEVLGAR